MARRLNWEKANFQDKAEKRADSEHVTIAGAPDMKTFFGNKLPLKKISDVEPKQGKKKNKVTKRPKTKTNSRTVICPECGMKLKAIGPTANHTRASLRAHTKRVHKDIFKALLTWEKQQRASRKNKAKTSTKKKGKANIAKQRKKSKARTSI